MDRLLLLILPAVCIAGNAFSQQQSVNSAKTVADAKKETTLPATADSLINRSKTCVLDLKKSPVPAGNTTGTPLLKNAGPATTELYFNNDKVIASPGPLKDEK